MFENGKMPTIYFENEKGKVHTWSAATPDENIEHERTRTRINRFLKIQNGTILIEFHGETRKIPPKSTTFRMTWGAPKNVSKLCFQVMFPSYVSKLCFQVNFPNIMPPTCFMGRKTPKTDENGNFP